MVEQLLSQTPENGIMISESYRGHHGQMCIANSSDPRIMITIPLADHANPKNAAFDSNHDVHKSLEEALNLVRSSDKVQTVKKLFEKNW